MTQAQVDHAVAALKARGESISLAKVNRELRKTPPTYRGCSYTDLLRFLKKPSVLTESQDAQRQLDAMAAAGRAALAGHVSRPALEQLTHEIDATWRTCAALSRIASAKGQDLTAVSQAFEALRVTREHLIFVIARPRH